jgi:integrase
LLDPVISDLLNWRKVQEEDQQVAGGAYQNTGFLVTNPMGSYIEPRTFSDYYHQILQLAGIKHCTFHALRHTFASRALEQGMDKKTLSTIMGHYSVSFTLDRYAHVLDDHKQQEMSCMEDLFFVNQALPQNLAYPVLVTPDSGKYLLQVLDFPEIQVAEHVCKGKK